MGGSSSLIFGRSVSLWSRWAVRAAPGSAPGSSVLHVPVIQPPWEKALPTAKTNLCSSRIHSVTFAQDELISQKEMALGDAGLQQIMRKNSLLEREEQLFVSPKSKTFMFIRTFYFCTQFFLSKAKRKNTMLILVNIYINVFILFLFIYIHLINYFYTKFFPTNHN